LRRTRAPMPVAVMVVLPSFLVILGGAKRRPEDLMPMSHLP